MSMMMTTTNDEFDVYLISTAWMDVFRDNTLATFTNLFSEPLNFSGDWRVALTEIFIPTATKKSLIRIIMFTLTNPELMKLMVL